MVAHETSEVAIVGLILAGGRSSRFGGGDKTLATLGGRPVLAWVIERLAPQCRALLLSANGDAGRFAPFELPVVADHAEDAGKGPLAGLLAGLDRVAGEGLGDAAVVTVPGDTPAVPHDLVSRLAAARRASGRAVAVARSGGRLHPLAALRPVTARMAVRHMLREDDHHRVRDCLERLGTTSVDWPDTPFDPFHNINRPDDLVTARVWAEGG